MTIYILIIVAMVELSLYVGSKIGVEKGIGIGRMQVLEEDLIRMDRPNNSSILNERVNAVINSNTVNHSRQACKYVESEQVAVAA